MLKKTVSIADVPSLEKEGWKPIANKDGKVTLVKLEEKPESKPEVKAPSEEKVAEPEDPKVAPTSKK